MLFKATGISFSLTDNIFYKIYSTTVVVIVLALFPLSQLLDAFKFYNDIDAFSNIFGAAMIFLTGSAKAMIIYLNRTRIEKTLNAFECSPFSPNAKIGGTYELQCVKQCIIRNNRTCVIFIISVYMAITCSVAKSALQRISSDDYHNWRVPIGSFTLFDTTYSPNFEIACCLQTVFVTICFTNSAACDLLITSILAHIATQYLLLQNRMRRMVQNECRTKMIDQKKRKRFLEQSVSKWEQLEKALRRTVNYHNEIINVTKQFEKQFCYLILVQVISTCITLCFVIYLWSTSSEMDFKLFQHIMAAISLSFEVLLYCYWGNEVTFESQAVLQACYECEFVGTDLRFQKCLLLIMKRCQTPQILTVGKFTALSLSTYVWIMRASYSASMVLRNTE